MEDAVAEAIKGQLDKELEFVDKNVGIAFGDELFAKFAERGWIAPADATLLGMVELPFKMTAYGTHYAFVSSPVKPTSYLVGKR